MLSSGILLERWSLWTGNQLGVQKVKMVKLETNKLKKQEPRKRPTTKKYGNSWATKMKRKQELNRIKALSKQVKEALDKDNEKAKEARRANKARQEENDRKNAVVVEIKNVKAIKKLSPKARRRARIYLKHEL